MELELHRTQMAGYEMVFDTTISHEETLEMIVPDAFPDILRIVDTDACVCIKGKEATDGRVEITGVMKAAAIYCPDGVPGMRRLELNIPFTATAEAASLRAGCSVHVMPRMKSAETRMLNPRKVLVRAEALLAVQVFAPLSESVGTRLNGADAMGLQQLCETHETYLVTTVQEKSFTFSDDVTISGSKAAAEEILAHRVDVRCNESKIIGNKLVFKGEAVVQAMYRSVAGTLGAARWELPFSQIMEVTGVREEAESELRVLLTGSEAVLAAAGEPGRAITVSLGLMAQAVVREERGLTVVSDAYATGCKLEVEMKSFSLQACLDSGALHQTVRDVLEPGTGVKSVEDVYLRIGQTEQSREDSELVLAADAVVTVLYTAEDDELYAATRELKAVCKVAAPEGAMCQFRCLAPDDVAAVPTAGGIEVRCAVEFRYLLVAGRRAAAVAAVRAEELPQRDAGRQPSIILRMVGHGERLWDVAKVYGTTMDDIVQANDLPDGVPAQDTLLLIPQKR